MEETKRDMCGMVIKIRANSPGADIDEAIKQVMEVVRQSGEDYAADREIADSLARERGGGVVRRKCGVCNGRGFVADFTCIGGQRLNCPECGGKGYIKIKECPTCDDYGYLREVWVEEVCEYQACSVGWLAPTPGTDIPCPDCEQ